MTRLFFIDLLLALSMILVSVEVVAQDTGDNAIKQLERSVVRITSGTDGDTRYGTGCVVGIAEDKIYIVTAAHVVRGDKHPRVEFAVAKGSLLQATVIAQESGEPGLAVLTVDRDNKRLSSLVALPPASVSTLERGSSVIVIGNPRSAPWSVTKPNVQAVQGRDIILDASLEAGYSGAPLVKDGRLQGLVFEADSSCSSAFHSASVWLYLSNNGLPSGILQEATGDAEPEYVTAKKRLREWGFDLTDRAFIDCLISGQVKAVRMYLVANPAWARLPFDARVLLKGSTPSDDGKSAVVPINALTIGVLSDQVDVVRELIRAGGFSDALFSAETVMGTPLMIAAMNGNPDIAQALIAAGADVNKQDSDHNTALLRAAQMGHFPEFEDEAGGSAFARRKSGDSYVKVAQVLLKAGADPNSEDDPSPLETAVENNNADMAALLLDGKADASGALATAIGGNNRQMVEVILSKSKTKPDASDLRSAVENCDNGLIQLLLSKGADVNGKCQYMYEGSAVDDWTALHQSVLSGKSATTEMLIARGAKVNAVTKPGPYSGTPALTPLALAVQSGDENMAALLLKMKADPRIRGRLSGFTNPTLLHIAVAKRNLGIVQLLLKNKAETDPKCTGMLYSGLTPLHLAAENGDKDIVEALVSAGADVNASASTASEGEVYRGYSPLHFASQYGRVDTVAFLVKHGANIWAKTSGGWTPVAWAKQHNQNEVVDLLNRLASP